MFVYGEDIWSVPTAGGVATRLTIHDGEERFPKFSPDGKLDRVHRRVRRQRRRLRDERPRRRDHARDLPPRLRRGRRLASDEEQDHLQRPDASSFSRFTRLFLVSPDGTGLEEAHHARGVERRAFRPTGRRSRTRATAREFRTWKRYKGGLAQDIYLFDFAKNKDAKITDFDGHRPDPDVDRRQDLLQLRPRPRAQHLLVRHEDRATSSRSRATPTTTSAGRAWAETRSSTSSADRSGSSTRRPGRTGEVPVEILADAAGDAALREGRRRSPSRGVDCSPVGKARARRRARRGLHRARGARTHAQPHAGLGLARQGRRVVARRQEDRLPLRQERRVRDLCRRSDGRWTKPTRLTTHKDGYRHTLRWSPDGKKIAFADQTLRCYYIDVASEEDRRSRQGATTRTSTSRSTSSRSTISRGRRTAVSSRTPRWTRISSTRSTSTRSETGETRCVSDGALQRFRSGLLQGRRSICSSSRTGASIRPSAISSGRWSTRRSPGSTPSRSQKDGEPLLPPPERRGEARKRTAKDDKKDGQGQEGSAGRRSTIDFDGIARRIEALPAAARQLPASRGERRGALLSRQGRGGFQPLRVPRASGRWTSTGSRSRTARRRR